MLDYDNLQNYRENNRIEAKQALGGLPESIWETYSAFANAEGGIILLGVEELSDKRLHALDILDPNWLIEDFWMILNDPAKVSANILKPDHVQIRNADGNTVIAITVPKADTSQKPVYIDNDIYRGTYRRIGEGDFRCSKEEVDAMISARRSCL